LPRPFAKEVKGKKGPHHRKTTGGTDNSGVSAHGEVRPVLGGFCRLTAVSDGTPAGCMAACLWLAWRGDGVNLPMAMVGVPCMKPILADSAAKAISRFRKIENQHDRTKWHGREVVGMTGGAVGIFPVGGRPAGVAARVGRRWGWNRGRTGAGTSLRHAGAGLAGDLGLIAAGHPLVWPLRWVNQ